MEPSLFLKFDAGADTVQIFDSWAKVVPTEHRKEWIISPIRRLISRIQISHPNTPIIYYGRGVSDLYPEIVRGFRNIVLGVDETVPVSVMRNQIQQLAPVQGNLSPDVLVEGGKKMKEKVEELLQTFQGTPFVFNLGHGIVPQTPIDHVAKLVELIRRGDFQK